MYKFILFIIIFWVFGCDTQKPKSQLQKQNTHQMLYATVTLSKSGEVIKDENLTAGAILEHAPKREDVVELSKYFEELGFSSHFADLPYVFSIEIQGPKRLFEEQFNIKVIERQKKLYINQFPNTEIKMDNDDAFKIVSRVSLNERYEYFEEEE